MKKEFKDRLFGCYLKSHCDAPDFETEVLAENKAQAVEKIYKQLRGDVDRDLIDRNTELL